MCSKFDNYLGSIVNMIWGTNMIIQEERESGFRQWIRSIHLSSKTSEENGYGHDIDVLIILH